MLPLCYFQYSIYPSHYMFHFKHIEFCIHMGYLFPIYQFSQTKTPIPPKIVHHKEKLRNYIYSYASLLLKNSYMLMNNWPSEYLIESLSDSLSVWFWHRVIDGRQLGASGHIFLAWAEVRVFPSFLFFWGRSIWPHSLVVVMFSFPAAILVRLWDSGKKWRNLEIY